MVKRVPGRGLEQREPEKTILYPQIIIIILISYIIIKLLINENHPSQKRELNSFKNVLQHLPWLDQGFTLAGKNRLEVDWIGDLGLVLR